MEQAIDVLVGLIGIPLMQLIKGITGWQGKIALIATIVLSMVLAVGAMYLSGQLLAVPVSAEQWSRTWFTVLATSLSIYKLFISKDI